MKTPIIEHIIISPEHNYVGHFGKPPGQAEAIRCDQVRLIAGHGIEGDRYALRPHGHAKQITFFDADVLDELIRHVGRTVPPEAVRRNVFTRGIDLNHLINVTFTLQGITLTGLEECRPCFWMDQAVMEGTEAWLNGRGGLRAAILSDGILSCGPAELTIAR